MSTARSEGMGSVTVITIDRPEARNAVDRPTAIELESAFRRFDQDDGQNVAVLTGGRYEIVDHLGPLNHTGASADDLRRALADHGLSSALVTSASKATTASFIETTI